MYWLKAESQPVFYTIKSSHQFCTKKYILKDSFVHKEKEENPYSPTIVNGHESQEEYRDTPTHNAKGRSTEVRSNTLDII